MTLFKKFLLVLLSSLMEKNPAKHSHTFSRRVPLVLSMARVIVVLFACAMIYQIRRAGIAGWPEATLCVAIVLAMPILAALERLEPAQVVETVKAVLPRFGEGAGRTVGAIYPVPPREPDKFDDHRDDQEAA